MPALPKPRLIDAVAGPIQRFFRLEAASGIVLLAAAATALLWANSPFGGAYRGLFEHPFDLRLGGHAVAISVEAVVSDGLMTLFFFLVGMEIKREVVAGELRSAARALLPAVAALGGMVVPAALYAIVAAGTPAVRGWGIPMATDIAFCIGCLTLLKRRVPHALIVYVTALAIFDDVGGILVIAIFYGHGMHWAALALAILVAGGLFAAGRAGVGRGLVYVAGGAVLWLALGQAGIHPTIAGVTVGLAIPARVRPGAPPDAEAPLDRMIRLWHPWVAFGIMPLFALASSGVPLTGEGTSVIGRPTLAAVLGLVVGKPVGIFGATFAAVALGLGERPGGASWFKLLGVAAIAGIGFTVALFMADLAFSGAETLLNQARAGILIGSLVSAAIGVALLRASPPVR